jgi:hypothetical protein
MAVGRGAPAGAKDQRGDRHMQKVGDLMADSLVEYMVAGFWYGVEIRAQIYEDLEELGLWERADDESE